jgi:hypothetical protein
MHDNSRLRELVDLDPSTACPPRPGRRSITPTRSSVLSRFESRDGDISGTPRRSSLKRVLPDSSSRTTSGVQRSVSTSQVSAMGQNCP